MGKKVKVVFDTNVWISVAMQKTLKDDFLKVSQNLTVYISPEIALEVSRVLQYPKIGEVLRKAGIRERDVLRIIADNSKKVEPTVQLHVISQDAQDDKILECALAAGTNLIVTGDQHLLELGKFKKVRILSPRDFFDSFR